MNYFTVVLLLSYRIYEANAHIDRPKGPLILRRDLEEVCLHTLEHNLHPDLQLGQCTPFFIRCQVDEQNQIKIRLGSCANGKVFLGDRCTEVTKMGKACLDTTNNLINYASGILSQVTGFCEKHSQKPIVFLGAAPECSRQAILCIPGGEVPAIPFACPKGFNIDPNSLSCVFSEPASCRFNDDKDSIIFPVLTTLNRMWCRHEKSLEDEDGPGLSRTADVPALPDSIRCRDWFVTCEKKKPQFAICAHGTIYDKHKHNCRKVKEEDQCPAQFDCRNNPWKNIVPDACSPDFVYCKGYTAIEFQCLKDAVLGEDGECVSKEFVDACRPKPPPDCVNGEVYDTKGKPCPDIPMIPEKECEEGDAEPLKDSCSLFKRCINGHFELRRCAKGSGFHPKVKECETTFKCPENDGPDIYHPEPKPDYPPPPPPPKPTLPPKQPDQPYYPNPPQQPDWSPHHQCREDPGRAGYHRDPLNCASFYQCASGRWVHKNCAPGTHFNPNGPFCDHIGNVPGC